MAELEFKQAETVQLAPDALLFINGSDVIEDKDGNTFEIRNDITNISVSLNIDAVPGTANFTISLPDHSIRRYADNRYSSLRLLSEIEIYYKGRYPLPKSQTSAKRYPYYPAFWGVIQSITDSYSDGTYNISVSCADILRWWQIANTNVRPSLSALDFFSFEKKIPRSIPEDQLQTEIEKGIPVRNSNNETIVSQNTKFAGYTIPNILLQLAIISTSNLTPIKDDPFSLVGNTENISADQAKQEILTYWESRFDQVGRSLRIFGFKNENGNLKLDDDILGECIPYVLNPEAIQVSGSNMKSNLEIANDLKETVSFEFFMDVNGELVFKPPFYNMDVRKNKNSVIEDIDIISWSFTQTEADVVSKIDVNGRLTKIYNVGEGFIKGVGYNVSLTKQFGFRSKSITMPWLTTKEKCLEYAKLELVRQNSNLVRGTFTIIGRPELRLGYPIFVPARDAFYYVVGLDHNFDFGGTFTTTVTVIAERKKILDNSGNAIKNSWFRNVGGLKDTKKLVDGESVTDSEPANFLQMFDDVCFGKKKKNDAKESNYVSTNDDVSAQPSIGWELKKDLTIENPDPLNDIQNTDGEGYELIPFFKYGMNLSFNSNSLMSKTISQNRNNLRSEKAQKLTPDTYNLTADPNNTALTLDDEGQSMLTIYDKSSAASRAQKVNPQRSNR